MNIPVLSIRQYRHGWERQDPIYLVPGKLLERGRKPAIVGRGYKGANTARSLTVSALTVKALWFRRKPAATNPFSWLPPAPHIPVVVGLKRFFPCRAALDLGDDVILLDDGFQHIRFSVTSTS